MSRKVSRRQFLTGSAALAAFAAMPAGLRRALALSPEHDLSNPVPLPDADGSLWIVGWTIMLDPPAIGAANRIASVDLYRGDDLLDRVVLDTRLGAVQRWYEPDVRPYVDDLRELRLDLDEPSTIVLYTTRGLGYARVDRLLYDASGALT